MIVIPFHVGGLDAIVRMIRRYTYPKGEAISDRAYNTRSVTRSGTAAQFVKGTQWHADPVVMPPFVDPPTVVRLRLQHRCLMCHKRCLIPCKFTAMEFQQLLKDELDSPARDAEHGGSSSVPPT